MNITKETDLLIIGGGAAGMSTAVSAYENGIRDILILERNNSLGGVLRQCIHNGFGLHRFKEDLTGVEFAQRYIDKIKEYKIPYMLECFVIDLSDDKVVTCVNPSEGLMKIKAKAIILAMGCRERTRNNILIPGVRGAGILTAGTAQRYLNLEGYIPGRSVVIVGSGDIGLIMARQFVLEGVEVKAVVEIMPYSGGLPRNMKQCIEDFGIPVYYNSSVTKISGRERVNSVEVCRLDENRRPIPETAMKIDCDTVMISAGLIPENELTEQAGIEMSSSTKGAAVDECNMTSVPGIFSCGNVLHVHDLVDFVAEEAEETAEYAASYILGNMDVSYSGTIEVLNGEGAGPVVPCRINRNIRAESANLMFRPRNKYRDAVITVKLGSRILAEQKSIALTPGEMCRISVAGDKLSGAAGPLVVSVTGTINN